MSASIVECGDGTVFNSVSQRCVPSTSDAGKIIAEIERRPRGYFVYGCPVDTVKNPISKYCVPIGSELGTLIADNIETRSRVPLRCLKGLVFDKERGRCVKGSGKLGMKVTGYGCDGYPEKGKEFVPHEEQMKVANWFINESRYPGITLNHSLGSGKTCTVIIIIDMLLKRFPDMRVFVYLPASLRPNFLQQYCSVCGSYRADVASRMRFVSYNYTFIADKLPTADELKGNIVVIEEMHTVIAGLINGGPHYETIYNNIAQANPKAIIGLTGTAISFSPLEMYYTAELMATQERNPFGDVTDFLEDLSFVDGQYLPKDIVEFKRMLSGIYSYLPSIIPLEGMKAYPLVRITNTYVPMVQYQYQLYIRVRDLEIAAHAPDTNLKAKNPQMYKLAKQIYYISASMIRSRQYCNMTYSLPKEGGDVKYSVETRTFVAACFNVDETTPLDLYAPKFARMLANVIRYPGKHVVYSEFKTRYGVRFGKEIVERAGYRCLSFTGDDNDQKRIETLDAWNDLNNAQGQRYKCLFITKAGAQGLNLFATRVQHIMEQSISPNDIPQVMGRCVRYKSHVMLPEEDREVLVIQYFAVTPGPDIEDSTLISEVPDNRKTSDFFALAKAEAKRRGVAVLKQVIEQMGLTPE